MRRLGLFALTLLLGLGLTACSDRAVNSPHPTGAEAGNTLFTAFSQRSPKNLDPAKSYSSDETPFTYSIYEPLYRYEYLVRPYQLAPRLAQEVVKPVFYDAQGRQLAEDVSGDKVAISVYDIPLRKGVLFEPHPAFALDTNGHPVYWPITPEQLAGKYSIADFPEVGSRELTAHDVVFAFRRLASPKVVSPVFSVMAEHLEGMREYSEQLKQVLESDASQPHWAVLQELGFPGVQALDDHTVRFRVLGKYPQFKYWLAMTFAAPVPWEAERFYDQPGMLRHGLSLNTWPVGTGPYRLIESIPNRRHVLERNPNFRGEPYPCHGEFEDASAGLLNDCGKPTPFIDRIVFTLEKESVPLLGKFLQGYYDVPAAQDADYGIALTVAAGDSPEKAQLYEDRGLQLLTSTEASIYYLGFNWLDPVVGRGDTPEQQERNRKLRQALSIAFDWEQYISIFLNGQGDVAHGPVPPGILGHHPLPEGRNRLVYELLDNVASRRPIEQARQLLAEAGYPDGRDARTGQPLLLYFDSAGGMGASASLDWMRRQLKQLNIELEIRATDYNRFQDKMRTGSAQMFMWGWMADYPDAENFLFLLYGPNAKAVNGGENASNYQNAEFDRLFEQMRFLDDGPKKEELVRRMVAIVQNDMPWMFGFLPRSGGAYQSWVRNARATQMVRDNLPYLRLEPKVRTEKIQQWNQPLWWPLWGVAGICLLVAGLAWWAARRREKATGLSAQANHNAGESP
ncbi:ABC transporter substrate-binding protein [Mesopusillimonas faecipullorum]|nr:ABC transporter substrate-binding protein [Mesopusillimonas faecipullorum]